MVLQFNQQLLNLNREIIKAAIPAWLFHLFNVTFISFIQSILLFLLAAPAYPLLLTSQIEGQITSADIAFVAVELGLILVEWFSDQQQWRKHWCPQDPTSSLTEADYQIAKKHYQKSAKVPAGFTQAEMDRGFVSTGLWAYSRHPNFAAEQTIWLVLYQWSCYGTKVLYSWAAVGPTFLVFLFQGSTWLTELITSGKYPEYNEYQRQVGIFLPSGLAYKAPAPKAPKIIRTSELAKKQKQK
jgi:steroid 5-alpha reductase family enzyme